MSEYTIAMRFISFAVAALAGSTASAAAAPAIQVDAWGKNTFRIRYSLDGKAAAYNGPGALQAAAPSTTPTEARAGAGAKANSWTNGNLAIVKGADGTLTVSRAATVIASISLATGPAPAGAVPEVANSTSLSITSPGAASGVPTAGSATSYFGFGEHENGKLDQRNTTYDMETCIEYSKSKGGEVCLPWIMVADDLGEGKHFQFGVLWNVGAYGAAQFGTPGDMGTQTWTGYNLDQADLLITTFPAEVNPLADGYAAPNYILGNYVDAVGHAPELPSWASGYWHSKNRYKTQQEVTDTMDIFAHNFSIPVSVFVVDFFNWAVMGNLTFDPAAFPDPKAMVDHLKRYGTEMMVSTWPFSQGASKTYAPLEEQGFAVYEGTNTTHAVAWPDHVCGNPCRLYDPSNPAARQWWWSMIKEGYADYGIKNFWLDAAEPEQMTGSPARSSFHVGSMQRYGMMFPWYHSLTYFEGLSASTDGADGIMLSRSAWAGMSKHRAALWNGDTRSQFSYLKQALTAGLNVQMSGIAWWTTDIGGYAGGKPATADFRELIVRWFQFGLTSPLFRQHGARDTEPWLLGNESFTYVRKIMGVRETLRPYVEGELAETARSGLPLNRPLLFDFPADAKAWDVTDQLMFGRQYMAAPVLEAGARNRTVYFPQGAAWVHYFTGETFAGGASATVDAPLEHFPLFEKVGA